MFAVSTLVKRVLFHDIIQLRRKLTYYEILDVPQGATVEAIKSAFVSKSKVSHPDAGGDRDQFIAVSEAYAVLSRPDLRKEYDREINAVESIHTFPQAKTYRASAEYVNPKRSASFENPYNKYEAARSASDHWTDYYAPYGMMRAKRNFEHNMEQPFWKDYSEFSLQHGGGAPQIASHKMIKPNWSLRWKRIGTILAIFTCGFSGFVLCMLTDHGVASFANVRRKFVALSVRLSLRNFDD